MTAQNPLQLPAGTSSGELLLPNGQPARGNTEPRIWTPPLRELTRETTFGYDVIDFARDDVGAPLDAWQEWVVIHGCELLPDGRPRFRQVLVLVARQNGKTHLCVILSLYWMFVDRVANILGTSTKLEYSKDSWREACKYARKSPILREEVMHRNAIRKSNGEVTLWRADEEELQYEDGSRYRIAAANEEGGRSQTNNRVIMDELRQHHSYDAYAAAEPTTSAVRDSQIWLMSNAGSDRSVVLNDQRDAALAYINSGVGDYRLGMFEYSAEDHADPLSLEAHLQANPNFGYRIDGEALMGKARVAVAKGGKILASHKTEYLCIRVRHSDPAVDEQKWLDCFDPGDLSRYRDRVTLCFDMSLDETHAMLVAAAVLPDGRVRIETVAMWDIVVLNAKGQLFDRQFRKHVEKVRARALGWMPKGPAAAKMATILGAKVNEESGKFEFKGKRPAWLPAQTTIAPLRGEVPAVCMGFASEVRTLNIAHNGDPVLRTHICGASKQYVGDSWVAARREPGQTDVNDALPCDGYYASAGAVFLARTLPQSPGKPRLIIPD